LPSVSAAAAPDCEPVWDPPPPVGAADGDGDGDGVGVGVVVRVADGEAVGFTLGLFAGELVAVAADDCGLAVDVGLGVGLGLGVEKHSQSFRFLITCGSFKAWSFGHGVGGQILNSIQARTMARIT